MANIHFHASAVEASSGATRRRYRQCRCSSSRSVFVHRRSWRHVMGDMARSRGVLGTI